MLRLRSPSSDRWLKAALADMDAVLVDHTHCEQKAATTALAFCTKYSDDPELVIRLAGLAAEEAEHFQRMARVCQARNLPLGHPGKDAYVGSLLKDLRPGLVEHRIDRLLVCALVEARSCERLKLLAEHLDAPELRSLYDALWRAEAGHHTVFFELAVRARTRLKSGQKQWTPNEAQADVAKRLDALCIKEAEVLASLPVRPAIH